MGKSKKGGSSSRHSGDKRKREPTPPSEDFGDSEYLEEVFSSESEGSPVHASPPASSNDSDDSQGIAAEVWTYIRAVERAGLEGSDESEYSSDEENSSESSEEGGGGDGGDGDETEAMVTAAKATARAVTAAARVAAATAAMAARAAAGAATRPVARRHWF
jgi:hypothetical protein